MEIHKNYTAQNMLESRSYVVLCMSVIYAEQSFRENPQNTQCLSGTEIDSNLQCTLIGQR